MPEERVELDILFNEETIDVGTDNVIVEISLPDPRVCTFLVTANLPRDCGLERTDDRSEGLGYDVLVTVLFGACPTNRFFL